MDDARALRFAGWAGIAFSVLSLIVIPLAPAAPPALGASGAAFADWYRAHRTGFLLGNYLGIAAFIPGFVHLAVLAMRFRVGPRGDLHGILVLATGTFTYAVFACSLVVFQVLPFVIAHEDAAETIGTLGAVWFALDGLAAVPFVLAVGVGTAATRALPAWVAKASWVVAVLAIVMSLGAVFTKPAWLAAGGPATLLGFGAFFAWVIALSVVFLRLGPVPRPVE